jgi:hypothetical protein
MAAEMMALGQSEFKRVLLERHPELADNTVALDEVRPIALPEGLRPIELAANSAHNDGGTGQANAEGSTIGGATARSPRRHKGSLRLS